ncbi:MAG: zinc-ribbon domain-containing protein [Oscillospiraceae bacterium]|nr:zinc-ribbon domain-containing protein [Oscillospiraceae bacterium]
MFCAKCGNQIEDGAAFCSKCGTANGQTNTQPDAVSARIKSVPAKGKVVNSTTHIESKYKTGKIITIVAFMGISLFIPLPEENWVLMFLLALAFFGLLGWNFLSGATMFIIRNIEKEQYASFINSENAADIVQLLIKPLASKGMRVGTSSAGSNLVVITYQERDYGLCFFREGYFTICPDRPVKMYGFEGMKVIKMPSIYEHSLEDFPIIAYNVQEVLKNK